MQQYFSGKRKPNADVLHYVSIHLNTNTDWLLTGEGSMFREEKKDRQEGPNWLTDWWLQADEAHRHWLEIQLKQINPTTNK